MNPETVATAFSALLIGGIVGGAILFALPPSRASVIAKAPIIVAIVAVGATAGSLYFSERAGFVPCELCWYQRIAMYPIAVIVPFGLLRGDRQVMNSAFVLAAIGLAISAYHVQLQWFPEQATSCSFDDPCTAKWVEGFGIFTIPQMAGMAFFLIVMLCVATTFGRVDADAGSAGATNP